MVRGRRAPTLTSWGRRPVADDGSRGCPRLTLSASAPRLQFMWGQRVYIASKAGVNTFTESLRWNWSSSTFASGWCCRGGRRIRALAKMPGHGCKTASPTPMPSWWAASSWHGSSLRRSRTPGTWPRRYGGSDRPAASGSAKIAVLKRMVAFFGRLPSRPARAESAGRPGRQLPTGFCKVAHSHHQAHVRSQQALWKRGQIDADDLKPFRSG